MANLWRMRHMRRIERSMMAHCLCAGGDKLMFLNKVKSLNLSKMIITQLNFCGYCLMRTSQNYEDLPRAIYVDSGLLTDVNKHSQL